MKKGFVFKSGFDSYKVDSIIGHGGSGTVYRVEDSYGDCFAIKALSLSCSHEKLKRFKNELYFCMEKVHPNIINVLDYGLYEQGGEESLFYVMPFYSTTLKQLTDKGQLSGVQIMNIFSKILDGVEAAHLLGVFHRDLKPENILLTDNYDQLVIADFGIAHFTEEQMQTLVSTSSQVRLANFTHHAPEQSIPGGKVDHRADISALGLILNQMFTNEVPRAPKYKTIASVQDDYAYLDPIIENMIAQNPNDRFSSIAEVKKKLIAYEREHVSLQKLSQFKGRVIPETEIDDPLVTDPIYITGLDYWTQGGVNTVVMSLSQIPNNLWIRYLRDPKDEKGQLSYMPGYEPSRLQAREGEKEIKMHGVPENNVGLVVNHFKNYVKNANRIYRLEKERRRAEGIAISQKRFTEEVENEKRRQKVLSSLKSLI